MGASRRSRSSPVNDYQIFVRRAKIWKNKSLGTLLSQANLADEYANA
jgi:hypothetical protein